MNLYSQLYVLIKEVKKTNKKQERKQLQTHQMTISPTLKNNLVSIIMLKHIPLPPS